MTGTCPSVTIGATTVDIIENSGILTLDGSVSISEIKQSPQGRILLSNKLLKKWSIDLIGDGTYEYIENQVIVEGCNGYKLTSGDLALIECKLPEGYSIMLNKELNTIILLTPEQVEGIVEITNDQSQSVEGVYDMLGRQKSVKGKVYKGIYIKDKRKRIIK